MSVVNKRTRKTPLVTSCVSVQQSSGVDRNKRAGDDDLHGQVVTERAFV